MTDDSTPDVVVVGGGLAGLSAGIFTARHDFETVVIDAGSPILRRNAHLENYPGFPAGVDARLLLEMVRDQAAEAGCDLQRGEVTRVADDAEGFVVETADGGCVSAPYVVLATKSDPDYLDVDGVETVDRGKVYVATAGGGRTGVEGLYAAGRLAEKPHQAVVAAGHGAEVGVSILEDDDSPFYHDWVAPDGYFTGRGRDLPPGCEEIDGAEHREREREVLDAMRSYVAEPHPEEPVQHPSVAEDD
ncbi:MAG: NAD(P)/FAD-dependent oxidoreductase [Haloferacaceae archaeon]